MTGNVGIEAPKTIRRKICQIFSAPVDRVDEGYRKLIGSWTRLNPFWRYELFTPQSAKEFVLEHYKESLEIIDTLNRFDDRIIHDDLVRYLIIYKEGGLYADIDTECTQPIDEWLPGDSLRSTGLVVGIEYDALGDPLDSEFDESVAFAQYAFMAQAGHPILRHVIDTTISRLQRFPTITGSGTIKKMKYCASLDLMLVNTSKKLGWVLTIA